MAKNYPISGGKYVFFKLYFLLIITALPSLWITAYLLSANVISVLPVVSFSSSLLLFVGVPPLLIYSTRLGLGFTILFSCLILPFLTFLAIKSIDESMPPISALFACFPALLNVIIIRYSVQLLRHETNDITPVNPRLKLFLSITPISFALLFFLLVYV